MPQKKKARSPKETSPEGIKIRLPGFEIIIIGRITTRTVIILVIALGFWLALCLIFFFQLS